MLTKSMMAYAVAFVVAIWVDRFVMQRIRIYLSRTRHKPASNIWIGLQWVSTAFLWSQWLIQDLATIFVYVPRQVPFECLIFCILVFVVLLGWIFYRSGPKYYREQNWGCGYSLSHDDRVYVCHHFVGVSRVGQYSNQYHIGILGLTGRA